MFCMYNTTKAVYKQSNFIRRQSQQDSPPAASGVIHMMDESRRHHGRLGYPVTGYYAQVVLKGSPELTRDDRTVVTTCNKIS